MLNRRRLLPVAGLLGLSMLATACPPPPPPAPLVIRDPASLGEANVLGDRGTLGGSVSRDGRYVVFGTESTNVQSSSSPSNPTLYLRDLQTGEVQRINGGTYARISGNGRYVTYRGQTSISVWDRITEQTQAFVPGAGSNLVPFVSDHGTTVVWGGFAFVLFNQTAACFVRDLPSGVDTACPPPPAATQPGTAELVTASRNTRFVVYKWTNDTDPLDVNNGYKVWDRSTGSVTDIVTPDFYVYVFAAAISDDGRFVAGVHGTMAQPDATPAVLDRATNVLNLMPVTPLPSNATLVPDMSSNGRFVAVVTLGSNLSPGDTNGEQDVYVWDTADNSIELASYNLDDGTTLSGRSFVCDYYAGAITDDGQVCVRTGESMVSLDTNGKADNYLVAAD